MKFFQTFAISVLILFMGILAAATTVAYTRKSGSTGLSMSQIQQMRIK